MENVKQVSLPDVTEAFTKSADALLDLDDGIAIQCHSQILSMHSAVILICFQTWPDTMGRSAFRFLATQKRSAQRCLLTSMGLACLAEAQPLKPMDEHTLMQQLWWRALRTPMTHRMCCAMLWTT